MKVLLSDYTFNASTKQITLNVSNTVTLDQLLVITNVTTNTIIYNFADPSAGGTVSNNVVTLDYDTTSMSNSDKLQIFYDNTYNPASEELLDALYDLIQKLEFLPAIRGTSADIRVSPLSTPNMSTLSTLSNQAAMGGWSSNTQIKDLDNINAIQSNINNVTV